MSIGLRPVSRPKGYWIFLAALFAAALFSQQSHVLRSGSSDRLDENTRTVVSSSPNGTCMPIAYDMSAVLDDGDNLRVLVVLGKGGGQTIKDVRFLKGTADATGRSPAERTRPSLPGISAMDQGA